MPKPFLTFVILNAVKDLLHLAQLTLHIEEDSSLRSELQKGCTLLQSAFIKNFRVSFKLLVSFFTYINHVTCFVVIYHNVASQIRA
jgi:hypothetical protein